MAGNANSGRRQEKPFRDALRLELAALGADSKALREVAKKLIAEAMNGEQWAVKELADRIDGKVATPLTGADGEEPVRLDLGIDALTAEERAVLREMVGRRRSLAET
jgi:hypothetical protein